ncbi:MAG: NAD(+) synthase, partial [Eubacteriales bacterium]|nr:NAD(+) synthase [Eubacteriales bacterium]
ISCAEKAFEGEYSPKEIRERLELFLRRFFNMQFKRSCMPDGPAVLGVSLSPRTGWCAPSDANSGAWLTRLP